MVKMVSFILYILYYNFLKEDKENIVKILAPPIY